MLLPLPNFLLERQIAEVTGSGIGRAVAIAFAAAVARVVIRDTQEAAAAQVAEEIGKTGQAVGADLRDPGRSTVFRRRGASIRSNRRVVQQCRHKPPPSVAGTDTG
jgi:NAD(P)-dependent dehydrogenase (short-subunit alcohol dehydrogenase family)